MEQKDIQPNEPMKVCPTCRKEVHALATKCPYCQSKLKVGSGGSVLVWAIIVIILFCGFAVIVGSRVDTSTDSSTGTQPTQPPEDPKKAALEACLSLAQQTYSDDWDAACKDAGKAANCKLSSIQAVVLDDRLTATKNDYYHTFPQ